MARLCASFSSSLQIGSALLKHAARSSNTSSRLRTFRRSVATCDVLHKKFNEPLHAYDWARPGGIASMMRLPVAENTDDLDACFVGVPIDHGTTHKSGTRFGPRQIRTESVIIRRTNAQTGADPFSSIQVADFGDVRVNLFNLRACCDDIREQYHKIIKNGCRPLTLGGDHTITYPILQAIGKKYGPVALVHIDAHTDCSDSYNGEKITHGTPLRRAIEENLLDCGKVVQIGLRGSTMTVGEFDFAKEKGLRVVHAKDCWFKSMAPLMAEVRDMIGNSPTYISFDIDGIDPCYAPGTGSPEIGGLTTFQAMEIIQGCRGLDVVGGDVVEVSPPYDTTGTTAITAANLLFEMLCVLPGVQYH